MRYLKISGISLAGALFLFISVGQFRQMGQGSEKVYKVVEGKHDFKPNDFPLPYFGVSKYEFSIRFEASSWWSIKDEDYEGGNDIHDWNKIGGMTNYLSPNNKQSVLMAWRPDTAYNVIQIAAFTNDSKGGFKAGPPRKVKVGDHATGNIKWFGKVAYYSYGDTIVKHRTSKPFVVRKIGPWFGGNQTAHKTMYLHLASHVK